MADDAKSESDQVMDLSRPDVTTKYRTAADIVNEVLLHVVGLCKDGADIATICKAGDDLLEEKASVVYKSSKIRKGVAFPTCISVNELCGHFSPLPSESRELKVGDLAKIDMGCHIDGFVAVVGTTIVVGEEEEITGKKAQAMRAAWMAAEGALRMVKVGNTNTQVTDVISRICKEFDVNLVQGIYSHQMKQHVIDGSQYIASRDVPDEKIPEFTFGLNEVYGIDIMVSTGEGKPKDAGVRCTVYKRDVERNYGMRTHLSREFYKEVNRKSPTLPFNIRAMGDENMCRIGITECLRHQVVQPYGVLTEKPGEFVAQFKYTVLLLPGGTKKITGLPFPDERVKCDMELKDEELKAIVSTTLNPKKKKKKAKAEKAAENGEVGATE